MRPKGFRHTKETRRKISLANKGRKILWGEKISERMKGKIRSDKSKEKQSNTLKQLISERKFEPHFKTGHPPTRGSFKKGYVRSEASIKKQSKTLKILYAERKLINPMERENSRKKASETRKRLFREGKLKLSSSCFKRRHVKSEETIKKHSEIMKRLAKDGKIKTCFKKGQFSGEKNPHWIDGRTPEYERVRHSEQMKQWRFYIFKRDNFTCQKCGVKGDGKNIEAHHIKSFSKYPKLRFDVDNGQTLCKHCHSLTDNYLNKGVSR